MAGSKEMKALQQSLSEKHAQLDRLKIEIAALEDVVRRASGEAVPEPVKRRTRRSNLKGWVLDLLKERADHGLNAAIAVEIAESRGEVVERGSVSSLLSRLKQENIVEYDGQIYRLPKGPGRPKSEEDQSIFH